jgi:hypothetical protein
MKVTVLINEQQRKKLLLESSFEQVGDIVKQNYDFVRKILKDSSKQMGMNLEFLVTWGASIGGFIGPLNDYIQGKFPEVSGMDLSLILTGVLSMYYLDNKELIRRIISKIKERGLSDIFSVAVRKSEEFKSTFFEFISSLNLTLHKVSNVMSYTFILPIIPMLFQLAQSGEFNQNDIRQISMRLAGFGLLTVSGNIIREIFTKIINRFKG